jgi:hypothetical protein
MVSVIFAVLIYPTQLALTLTDTSTHQLVHVEAIRVKQGFSIYFIHSIHKTPVEEQFIVGDDHSMILDRVIYETYGVGNPSEPEPGQTFRMEDGKLIIENMNRRFPYIDQRIGQRIANHQLIVKDKKTPFTAWSKPGSRIRIEVKKISLWTLWRGGTSDVQSSTTNE